MRTLDLLPVARAFVVAIGHARDDRRLVLLGRAVRTCRMHPHASAIAPVLAELVQTTLRVGRDEAERALADAVRSLQDLPSDDAISVMLRRDDAQSLLVVGRVVGIDVDDYDEDLVEADETFRPMSHKIPPDRVVSPADAAAVARDDTAWLFFIASSPGWSWWWIEALRTALADLWAIQAASAGEAIEALALLRDLPTRPGRDWSPESIALLNGSRGPVETGWLAEDFEADGGASVWSGDAPPDHPGIPDVSERGLPTGFVLCYLGRFIRLGEAAAVRAAVRYLSDDENRAELVGFAAQLGEQFHESVRLAVDDHAQERVELILAALEARDDLASLDAMYDAVVRNDPSLSEPLRLLRDETRGVTASVDALASRSDLSDRARECLAVGDGSATAAPSVRRVWLDEAAQLVPSSWWLGPVALAGVGATPKVLRLAASVLQQANVSRVRLLHDPSAWTKEIVDDLATAPDRTYSYLLPGVVRALAEEREPTAGLAAFRRCNTARLGAANATQRKEIARCLARALANCFDAAGFSSVLTHTMGAFADLGIDEDATPALDLPEDAWKARDARSSRDVESEFHTPFENLSSMLELNKYDGPTGVFRMNGWEYADAALQHLLRLLAHPVGLEVHLEVGAKVESGRQGVLAIGRQRLLDVIVANSDTPLRNDLLSNKVVLGEWHTYDLLKRASGSGSDSGEPFGKAALRNATLVTTVHTDLESAARRFCDQAGVPVDLSERSGHVHLAHANGREGLRRFLSPKGNRQEFFLLGSNDAQFLSRHFDNRVLARRTVEYATELFLTTSDQNLAPVVSYLASLWPVAIGMIKLLANKSDDSSVGKGLRAWAEQHPGCVAALGEHLRAQVNSGLCLREAGIRGAFVESTDDLYDLILKHHSLPRPRDGAPSQPPSDDTAEQPAPTVH